MPLTKEIKGDIIAQRKTHETDSGSSDVQISLLTSRIQQLTAHLKVNSHDHSSRRGLLRLVSRRRHLLSYLAKHEPDRYRALIAALGLRK